ncbi:MAG TPA: DUF6519 domain-containing protein [Chloroflexota bacterium]|jgi:hypothetical protein
MNGDFTRLTFRPDRHYSGVRLQQGRLLLDADWNEQVDIATYRGETSLDDTIGRCGAPLHDAGFALRPSPGTSDVWSGILGAGRYYVDGILCQNEFETLFSGQPDLIGAALPTASGTYLAYLDVWQRHVSALEQPDLLEVALGGPDTTTRTQTIWQVKLELVGSVTANVTRSTFGDDWLPADVASTGRLRARSEPSPQSNSVCLVPPGAGFRRLENQLYRVEIHTPTAGDGQPGPTFKWSRENASVATRLEHVQVVARQGGEDTLLTVSDAGRDDTRGFTPGNWVELIDERRLLANRPGIMVQLSGVSGSRLTVSDWPASIARPDNDRLSFELWQVRRWDSANGVDAVRTGSPDQPAFLELEDGVQVEFSGGTYRTGDYWLIPARSSIGDVDWPRVGDQSVFQRRHGIEHHYCPLALLRSDGTIWTIVGDVRSVFPPTTELVNLTYVGGGGQQALANPSGPGLRPLAQPLQARVVNGQWPVAGASVVFRIVTPDAAGPVGGLLSTGPATGSEVRVVTGADGIASCSWTLDEDERHHTQRVVALLLDNGTTRSPVAFDAQLNRASLVAYTPGACVALSNVRTVQDALDQLCQTGSGREPAMHVVRLALQNGSELANDTDIGVDAVAQGINVQVAFDQRAGQALNPVSVNRATCYLALELPYPLSTTDRTLWNLTSGTLGFESLVLDGQVNVSASSIVWQPTTTTATWLRSGLFDVVTRVTQIDRILARLTLKGNFIASLADGSTAPSLLDGETFGSSGRDRTAIQLPSGEGHRGGDFEMWFWLVQNAGLANVTITPTSAVVIGGAPAHVSITLTGPAPSAGTTIQIFVDGDPTGTIRVPDTVRIPAGARDAAFDVLTQPVATTVSASIRVVMTTAGRSESRAVNLTVQSPVVDQLTLNPAALDSGGVAQATLTLTGPAPAGGLPVRMATTDSNATSFPDIPSGTVTVPAGQSTLSIRVSTNPAVGNTSVTVSATPAAPGRPAQANLTIRRLTLSGPTFSPTEVIGGTPSVGTLTLSGPAPVGGAPVDLSPAARVSLTDLQGNPTTAILVAAGNRSATFRAIPEGSLARTSLPVNTILRVGGATSSGALVVSPSLVGSVGVSPSAVLGGPTTTVTGVVTLTGPAPREGAVVNLSANPGIVSFRNPAGAPVGSVVVPAGATTAAFGVATPRLGTGDDQTVTILASIPSQSSASTILIVRGPTKSPQSEGGDGGGGGGGGKLQREQIAPFFPSSLQPASGQPDSEAFGRAFIEPEERPDVGAAALQEAAPPTQERAPATEERPKRVRRRRKQPG